ncbi:YCII-related domain-containing protein [Streptomyces yunnanensis]|uniref:YCII-related domain-containing protein n=1 Tax=Streptomyces yunnanensis TaxID=156453 RepID=A0A9X8QXY4_9ACTN|nr:YCII-related domain-containing protein [Streptomyces yunnanensis]
MTCLFFSTATNATSPVPAPCCTPELRWHCGAGTTRQPKRFAKSSRNWPAQAGEETLGGWFIIEVADRAEALELAKSLPTPETIEIRPILESA